MEYLEVSCYRELQVKCSGHELDAGDGAIHHGRISDSGKVTQMSKGPPKFERPPVIETVLGVQFPPIAGFRNAHLGAFWKANYPDWEVPNDVPPLAPQYERFEESELKAAVQPQLVFSQDPSMRIQIQNSTGDRMVQLQNGRLHYNWLTGPEQASYPDYSTVREEFDRALNGFRSFLIREHLNPFSPDQWEITYVNHIPQGTVWNTPSDWVRVLSALLGRTDQIKTTRFESCGGSWRFEITPQRGRLHVELSHGWTNDQESQQLLMLKLTARGPIQRNGLSLDEGLNLGHDAIVQTFREITSRRAREYWGESL